MLVIISCLITLIILYKTIDWLLRLPTVDGISSKYVLVTGCDSGFGYQLAQQLEKKGFYVFATCLTASGEHKLNSVTSERVKTIRMDVTSSSNIKEVAEMVKKFLPENTGLWGLVNNAGVTGVGGPCDWHTKKHYSDCFDVNVFGMIESTIAFLPLIKISQGRIVNVSSVMGRFAVSGPYSVSKFAVEAFSDGLRIVMRCFGVSVSIIEPGFFRTEMVTYDNIVKPLDQVWKNLNTEIQEEYGEEFFENLKSNTAKALELCSDKTYLVVDAMVHALTSVRPMTRYSVGWDAKLVWIPLSLLPSCICDPIHLYLNNFSLPKIMQKRQ